MKMPCEDCLKYAICKRKLMIECDDLQTVFDAILYNMKSSSTSKPYNIKYLYLDPYGRDKAWKGTWVEIRKTLPNIKSIYRDQHHEYTM